MQWELFGYAQKTEEKLNCFTIRIYSNEGKKRLMGKISSSSPTKEKRKGGTQLKLWSRAMFFPTLFAPAVTTLGLFVTTKETDLSIKWSGGTQSDEE